MNSRLVLALGACAAALLCARPAAAQTDTTHAAPAPAPARREHRDRNLITAEEIAEHPAQNAYDLVFALRPAWLRGHAGGRTPVMVFQDGQEMGTANSALRRIPVETITELRFMEASDAVMRWGMQYGAGIIMVSTR